MSTLLIDNYDSFSYNLYQILGSSDPDISVVRNDAVTADDILGMGIGRIVISPGPGRPVDAGNCVDIIRRCAGKVPILGVCLGHQAICTAYGATVTYAGRLMHGKASECDVDVTSELFRDTGPRITVGRYHSLAVDPATLPADLRITALTDEGEVMAVEDRRRRVFGLQFHPESVLTPEGAGILRTFMEVRI